jgi:hypothetical protein
VYAEESMFWGYDAYKNGQSLGSGQNPIPEAIRAEATEIRWLSVDPLTIEQPLFEDESNA